VYETFKSMHPGLPVLALHGKMPQLKRMDVYKTFNSHAKCALFTTDVGARGLGKSLEKFS
jgi:ATP-dependent RNA helicase DDX10/DBP4